MQHTETESEHVIEEAAKHEGTEAENVMKEAAKYVDTETENVIEEAAKYVASIMPYLPGSVCPCRGGLSVPVRSHALAFLAYLTSRTSSTSLTLIYLHRCLRQKRGP